MSTTTTTQTDAQRANMPQAEWDALTDVQRSELRAGFPSMPVPIPVSSPVVLTPIRSVDPVSTETDAQRAGMTEAEWDALTDAQRATRRAAFPPIASATASGALSDARRAGLTASQWNALTEAERIDYRRMYPDPNPPATAVPVPSPPDPHNLPSGTAHAVAASLPAGKDDSFEGLPNTAGGRNNPSMSFFDPTRPATA